MLMIPVITNFGNYWPLHGSMWCGRFYVPCSGDAPFIVGGSLISVRLLVRPWTSAVAIGIDYGQNAI